MIELIGLLIDSLGDTLVLQRKWF